MKTTNSLGKRLAALALSFVLVLGMLPVNAMAAPSGSYGTVSTYTGGTVTGNGTESVEVLVEETTLQWSPADASIGRSEDGWWVGIDVVAPANYSNDATYKVKTNPAAAYGEEKRFADHKDGEKDIQLWFPVSVENLEKFSKEDRNLTMTYAFDWDADTVYEQTVVFSVDPKGDVVLMKDSVQHYPKQGSVSTYTGGTVSGDKTSDVSVVIEDAQLQWSPADTTIGRNEAGWWVGIKVEAPVGMDASVLQNAKYQSKGNPNISWDDIAEVKSFWTNKDSQDSEEAQYIQLWFRLTPASLEKFQNEGRNITMVYRFDWDGNSAYDQTVTFSVVPSERIVLTKVEQSGFAFATPMPADQWTGESYTNTAGGGQGTGAVSYAITAGADVADIDAATGELTFKKAGTVTVTATKAADDTYKETTASYTVTAIRYSQEEFKFATSNPSAIGFAAGSYTNLAAGGSGSGEVTYRVVSGDDVATVDAEGKLTFLKAGEVTVEATKAADKDYFETTATYTLTIEKSAQGALVITPTVTDNKVVYQAQAQSVLAVEGGSGKGELSYSVIDGSEYAQINSKTGEITILKAGGYFTVQVDKAGDTGYNAAAPVTVKLYAEHAEQTGFAFAEQTPGNVTYNDNGNVFTNAADGGQGTGAVSYAVTAGADVADIDAATGKLTIKKAGTVTVQATKAADDCYKAVTAEYSLTVEKAAPEFTVTGNVQLVYGTTEYAIPAPTTSVGGSGAYSYAIVGENNIGASVDVASGVVTFGNSEGKVGIITIEVTKAEDDQYEEASKTFLLAVAYPDFTAVQPTVSGDTKNTSGWYTGDATIHAPEGYQISYSNALQGNSWDDTVTVTAEGEHDKTVYLKKGNEISDGIAVNGIKIDKTIPAVAITYDTTFLEKVLNAVTFGIYQSERVTVTLTATDAVSGVASLSYNIGGEDITVNKTNISDEGKYQFTIPAQFRNKVTAAATDTAGWTSVVTESGHLLVVDTANPELEVAYNFAGSQNDVEGTSYTNDNVTAVFEITETNFDLRDADPDFTVNGTPSALTWTHDGEHKIWTAAYTLSAEGAYVLALSYTDESGNKMADYAKTIIIDRTAPVISSVYGGTPVVDQIFNADRTATFTVEESNFDAQHVELTVTAKDITAADVDISAKGYAAYAKDADNWTHDGYKHALTLPVFDIDAVYTVDIDYTDLAENTAADYTADEFTVDKTTPTDLEITYSTPISDVWEKVLNTVTFGYYPYKEEVEVTLTAEDVTSGVDFFAWTYTQEDGTSASNAADTGTTIETGDITYSNNGKTATATFKIEANARGYISATVTDKAGNSTEKSDDTRINVVDNVAPTRTVSYMPERVLDAAALVDATTSFNEDDKVILYYKEKAVVTFKITEANFYAEDVVIKVNDVEKTPTDWTKAPNSDEWTGTITIEGDGDYVVTMEYTDRSTNEMSEYKSQKIAIDKTAPTIKVEYDNNEACNDNHYKADRTATITITDHNFRADDVAATVMAKDVQGNPVVVNDYAEYLSNRSNWTSNGDTHVATITYSTDAIYTFDITYADIVGNAAAEFAEQTFAVDHAAPTGLTISYSEAIVEKVIEALTFGFYQPNVTVTLTAEDATTGVDFFVWTYTKEDGTSDKNAATTDATIETGDIAYSNNGKTATATFKIEANARGYISATVTDKAGNSAAKTDDTRINVVDNVAPKISVGYTAGNGTLVQFIDNGQATVDSFTKAAAAYYNGDVTARIVIDEANFFEGTVTKDGGIIHNVGVKLTKTDDNGTVTVYEYLPEGAEQKYTGAVARYITWATDGDEHSFDIVYADNADYVLEIEYTDLSTNAAEISADDGMKVTGAYQSKVVTVDKTAPVVSVVYGNEKVIHTIDGRDYFDAAQTATITVTEHNFRADDFAAVVTAKDVTGADVTVEDFAATLADDAKWTKNGDIYTITVQYPVDANYTFDYVYKDMARNEAAAYDADLFTVDTTDPEAPAVSYSTSVLDKILESVTFGYYNAQMTVTITAEDDTAGIHYFVYSYIKSEGVSDVNSELINDKIEEANNRIVRNGKTFTTSFTVPKLILDGDNQFNGTVEFTAFDRSENSIGKEDDRRVVVDNIAPTAMITYNQPVQSANNISYYAGNIEAKIVINEANFYSEDVVVTVTRDGADNPVNVAWVDESVDVHTGTFTLTADGDYIVTVAYDDRSGNQMTTYTSNRLTLDTKAPTVSVSNIRNNSANKDEKFGFTITANDINLDSASVQPVLTATVKAADGSYVTKTVSLGEMRTVEAGKTYTFTVDNLEEDAVYSLVCTLKDMSGNQYAKIALDSGETYDEVRFSVNRNGSTFAVDKDTDALVNQYYVYSVDEDVVIEEINVDPIENYAVKLNGKVLTEGADYTTTQSNRSGEWSKRTYSIHKKLFEAEGEYSIVVESTDKAETTAYSDVKNLNVSFVVDQTAPVLTISGLEGGGRYQVEEQTVTVIPTDDGGRLNSIKVVVLDSDGEPLKDESGKDISVRFEMSGEEFLTYLEENDGKVTFTVPEGLENQVQIICNDYAVNAEGKTNEFNETYEKVTVSQSQWIIFYANKPLFFGTVAGIAVLVGGSIALISLKKKKKLIKK